MRKFLMISALRPNSNSPAVPLVRLTTRSREWRARRLRTGYRRMQVALNAADFEVEARSGIESDLGDEVRRKSRLAR